MDYLIYSITIEETVIKLVNNSLGFCLYIEKGIHTTIFVNSSLDESLAMMQCLMNLFSQLVF